MLFYPVTDASFDTASYDQFATGYFLRRDAMLWFWDQYTTDDAQRDEITASPLRATTEQLTGLPPALVITAEADVLRDEGEAYASQLRAAGVPVTATRYQGVIHDFVMLNALRETHAAQAAIAQATATLRTAFAAPPKPRHRSTIMTSNRLRHFLDQLESVGYIGSVALPGDRSYAEARAAWNLKADQLPAAVVRPEEAEDVQQVVIAAVAAGLRVAPQRTGHNATPLEPLHDAVLVKTDRLHDVVVDVVRRTATVGAGVLWEDVAIAARKEGLTALHGSSPNVGVAGYLLGGGLSWFARSHGLASNHVRGIDIVLADGRHVHADAENNAELFWAVRGGGGNFGVVTSIEIELFEVESVYAGMMLWDQVHAERILRVWRDWATTAPANITTSFRLINFPRFLRSPTTSAGVAS